MNQKKRKLYESFLTYNTSHRSDLAASIWGWTVISFRGWTWAYRLSFWGQNCRGRRNSTGSRIIFRPIHLYMRSLVRRLVWRGGICGFPPRHFTPRIHFCIWPIIWIPLNPSFIKSLTPSTNIWIFLRHISLFKTKISSVTKYEVSIVRESH